MLGRKEEVVKAQKKQVDERHRLRGDYQSFLASDGGKHHIVYLDSLAASYFQRAMGEPDRDKKATLVDTVAGVMLARRHLVDMGAEPKAEKPAPVDTQAE